MTLYIGHSIKDAFRSDFIGAYSATGCERRMAENVSAFTGVYPPKTDKIQTPIYLMARDTIETSVLIDKPNTSNNSYQRIALWDTGATRSAIKDEVALGLGLESIGRDMVRFASGQELAVEVYKVDLTFVFDEMRLTIPDFEVRGGLDPSTDYSMILGMDFFRLGDFAITNYGGQMMVSFRYPSLGQIDFTKEQLREPS